MNPARTQRYFKIGEAAKLLGLSCETLRRWEKAGKVSFSRSPGGKRLFSEADLENIRHLLKPTHGYTQTSTPVLQPQNLNNDQQEKITISISIPKFGFPKFNFNYRKISIALAILILIGGNIFFFLQTPYSHPVRDAISNGTQQAVLGAETFIAPALEEGGPVSSLFLQAGKTFSALGSLLRNNPVSSLVVPLVGKSELSTNGNLEVTGKGHIAKNLQIDKDLKVDGTAIIGKIVTGVIDPYLIENDGSVQNTLEIKSVGNISLVPTGNVTVGSIAIGGNNISGVNNLTTTNLTTNTLTIQGNISTPKLTTTSDITIGGNITLTGVINSDTLTDTKLVFAGSSPSIYAGTTNTGISLNANGTGAISIGNSSKGDIYIGGGSTSTTYCLITNSSANLNCGGDITAVGTVYTTGGSLKTTATTGNVFNTTATTLNIGGAGTTISIGASTGTTTVNNALTATGALTGSSTLSITGATTLSSTLAVTGTTSLNGAVNIGSATTNDIAVNGRVTTSIVPKTTGSVDLGSSSLKFNNLYSLTINTTSTNTSGQAAFTQNPASTAITDASLLINPTTVTNAGSALLGIAVAGVEKARIDETGKLTLQGGLSVASGTTTNTSTTTSGDIFAFTDTSLTATGANLSNFTFKNNNSAGSSTVNGITVTEQAANAGGTNTSNLVNLSAAANGTVNGVNISSATGFTNFFKTPTFNLDSSGNVTGVVGLTATTLTGTISTASQTNITAVGTLTSLAVTGNVNSASGSLQTNTVTRIDNSGNLTAGTGSFGGTVTPSLDATYNFGSAVLRWNNAFFAGDVTAGDIVFKNKFRMTENGNGIDFYSPKGEKVASIDENGNFWVKGEIKHGSR